MWIDMLIAADKNERIKLCPIQSSKGREILECTGRKAEHHLSSVIYIESKMINSARYSADGARVVIASGCVAYIMDLSDTGEVIVSLNHHFVEDRY
jgi:hypothetical protein